MKHKRLLSMLLALIMVLSLLPVSALAAENLNLTIGVKETLTGSGRDAYSHSWASSAPEVVKVDNVNSRQTTVEGLSAGNATITHTYYTFEWHFWHWDWTQRTETWNVTVGTTSQNVYNVYVYVQITGDIPEGLVINSSGWYTLGKIQLAIGQPKNTDNIIDTVRSTLGIALEGIERYAPNNSFPLDDINWDSLHGVATGANDYVESGWTWHLDGSINVQKIPQYTVTYTDGVETEEVFKDQVTTVLSGTETPAFDDGNEDSTDGNIPTRSGYVFTGWKPNVDATVTGDVTYTATWKVDNWKNDDDNGDSETGGDGIPDSQQALIKYVAEAGGSVAPAIQVVTLEDNDGTGGFAGEVRVSAVATPDFGHKFVKWTAPDKSESTVAELVGDLTVAGGGVYIYTASFAYATVTMTFDANGGAWAEAVEGYTMDDGKTTAAMEYSFENAVAQGIPVAEIGTVPVREGYDFLGWYSKNSGGQLTAKWWNFKDTTEYIIADQTVYAKWAETEVPPTPPVDPPADKTGTLMVVLQDDNGAMLADDVTVIPVKNSYKISDVAGDDVDYKYETSITYNDVHYVFEKVAAGDLTGTVTKDGQQFVVILQYTKDTIPTPTVPSTPPALNRADHYAYIIGYPDGTVRPEGDITRAEVATIFFRLLEDEVRDSNLTKENSFSDVSAGDWYCTAVSTMAKLGIVTGYPDGTFRPNEAITRAELAAIAARFDDSKVISSDFSDMSGHWAEALVERAAALGWVNGYPDGTFKPDQDITRAEAMTLINNVLDRIPETAADLRDDMHVWPDNAKDAWYYIAVQEATVSHEYVRKSGSDFERWTALRNDPDWSRYNG